MLHHWYVNQSDSINFMVFNSSPPPAVPFAHPKLWILKSTWLRRKKKISFCLLEELRESGVCVRQVLMANRPDSWLFPCNKDRPHGLITGAFCQVFFKWITTFALERRGKKVCNASKTRCLSNVPPSSGICFFYCSPSLVLDIWKKKNIKQSLGPFFE